MGVLIRFPDAWRKSRGAPLPAEPATVVILPVVRIERPEEKKVAARARPSVRRRRRPASRNA